MGLRIKPLEGRVLPHLPIKPLSEGGVWLPSREIWCLHPFLGMEWSVKLVTARAQSNVPVTLELFNLQR